ncbi:MAG: hypothetical protein HDR41_01915 [Lactobacillus sp.]|nr:hypothetical protein [Lactobacillus sp.]
MKKNTKVILASLSLLATAAISTPVLADSTTPAQTPVVATNTAAKTVDANSQTVTMAITKTGSTQPSEAAMFLGNSAQVTLKDGKVSEITIHVDGSKNPMTKSQDMSKMISAISLNGVAGKAENVAKDGSSLDFVFPADAYKEGKGTLAFTLNVMGKTMNETADVTLGKLANTGASNTETTSEKTDKKTTKTSKNTTKKAHAIKRTLKHNAYIYDKKGKRVGKKVLKKHSKVSTYGKAIKLHGKNFYRISKNQYVKKANF